MNRFENFQVFYLPYFTITESFLNTDKIQVWFKSKYAEIMIKTELRNLIKNMSNLLWMCFAPSTFKVSLIKNILSRRYILCSRSVWIQLLKNFGKTDSNRKTSKQEL